MLTFAITMTHDNEGPTKKQPSYFFELVHGGLMFIGLGLILPFGAMFANSRTEHFNAGQWRVYHQRLQYAAYVKAT